jgi:putative NADH-flavin reductase
LTLTVIAPREVAINGYVGRRISRYAPARKHQITCTVQDWNQT